MYAVQISSPPIPPREEHLEELAWTEVREAGCYLLVGSGGLVRIPCSSSAPAPSVSEVGAELQGPWLVKLSDDPEETSSALRAVAARHGYAFGF
jgi:hypothetical protein